MMIYLSRQIFLAISALTLYVGPATAEQFNGSYTLDTGEVLAFMAEGTTQPDLDTVIIDSFLMTPTFDGVAPVVENPQFFENTVSFSGAVLDLSWFGDNSVGFQLAGNFGFFSSGPGYGNTQESLNNSFVLTQKPVPEPTSLALLALGGLVLCCKRRG